MKPLTMMTLERGFTFGMAVRVFPFRPTIFLIMLVLLSFTMHGRTEEIDNTKLVGLWKRMNDTSHAVFLRKSNGVLEEKIVFYNGFNYPDVVVRARGHWRIKKNMYIIVLDYISNSTYKTSLHRPFAQEILHLNSGKFSYVSTDGVDEVERRINVASDVAFEQEKLEPFTHLKP